MQDIKAEYDFIIVGAGSAGSVIANRLTENENWNVLLIEAGEDESVAGQVPGLAASLVQSKYDWNFMSTPQGNKSCVGVKNNRYQRIAIQQCARET